MALTPDEVKALPTPYDPDPDYKAWKAGEFHRTYVYGGNRGMAGCWRKGILAALAGEPLTAVPGYDRARTYRGGVTWGRAYERAWCEGWHWATYGGDMSRCKLQVNHTAVPCSFERQPAPHEAVGA